MTEKKERKPDVTGRKLKLKGYQYKIKELTKEQKKEQREGIKEKDPKTGRIITYEPPDYNYYYKSVGESTVKIFKVGDRFYYKNVWLRYMSSLEAIEVSTQVDAQYQNLQDKVVDTLPISDTVTLNEKKDIPTGWDLIILKGGPESLDGAQRVWKISFPMYCIQFLGEEGRVKVARYKRSMPIVQEDGEKKRVNLKDNIYHFDSIIE